VGHDLFISYCRADKGWVEEEFLPVLDSIGVIPFIDDGVFRREENSRWIDGLQPGDELQPALRRAMETALYVVLVLTPNHFASSWCRWEMDEAERLLDGTGGRPKLIQLLLSKGPGGSLDMSPRGKQFNYIDLHEVQTRCSKMEAIVGLLGRDVRNVNLFLGEYSKKQLSQDSGIRKGFLDFQKEHQHFTTKVKTMAALKKIHDAIQAAQDAWMALKDFPVKTGDVDSDDLKEKAMVLRDRCDTIVETSESPLVENERFIWKMPLKRSVDSISQLLGCNSSGDIGIEEAYLKCLERTRGFLFCSTVPTELSNRILMESENISIEMLKSTAGALERLGALPWTDSIKKEFDDLGLVFQQMENLLADLKLAIAVHRHLQDMENLASQAFQERVSGYEIENNWIEIEGYLEEIRATGMTLRWLEELEAAAAGISACLAPQGERAESILDTLVFEEISKIARPFRRRLNFGFNQTDSDVLSKTDKLGKLNGKVDDFFDNWWTS